MPKYFLILFFSLLGELYAKVEFSSPFVKNISFSIKEGRVYSNNPTSTVITIKNQLRYLFGALNEIDSGLDFPNLKIKIKNQKNMNGLFEINYKASGIIAWNIKKEIPRIFNFVLPKRADDIGLVDFLNKYQKNCAKKPPNIATFWNYYRPHHEGCPFKESINDDVVVLSAKLHEIRISDENHEPNYRQIFEDNVLEITTIMTKENSAEAQDVSVSNFKNLCVFFAKDASAITQSSNECHIEGFKNGQRVKGNIFLIDDYNANPDLFLQNLTSYFKTSDIVTYNGHSSMGLNVESWMKYYPIPKGKYQIIFLNSCDTFGYFKNEFFDKIKNLNQAQSSAEYVDVILNATPNFFGTFAISNKYLVNSLLKNSNFEELMKPLPLEQHSLLLHESN